MLILRNQKQQQNQDLKKKTFGEQETNWTNLAVHKEGDFFSWSQFFL